MWSGHHDDVVVLPARSAARARRVRGAEALVGSLVEAGVDVCFMNPGTSEMHFVQALDSVPEMRGVLTLFEGVATGAADAYARLAGRPAAVLLHLGPGLGNGMANLHNARRAGTPLLCVVGAHATSHVRHDAPLESDITALARTVSGWVHVCGDVRDVADDAMRAVAATSERGGQVATLVLPADVSWSEGGGPRARPARGGTVPAGALAGGGGREGGARARGGDPPGRPGADRGGDGRRGPGRGRDRRAPADGDVPAALGHRRRPPAGGQAGLLRRAGARAARGGVVAGAGRGAVAGVVLRLPRGPRGPRARGVHGGRAGRRRVRRGRRPWRRWRPRWRRTRVADPAPRDAPEPAPGPLDVRSLCAAVAATLPEDAIVVDESLTAAAVLAPALQTAAPHTQLALTGGAIGQGPPAALGAAIAAPDRPVVAVQADGSALYTLQALWTQAREQLDVTTVLINNSAYAILRVELARTGAGEAAHSGRAGRMLTLADPTPDFVSLATGYGVPARRVETTEDLLEALRWAHARARPAPDRGDRPGAGVGAQGRTAEAVADPCCPSNRRVTLPIVGGAAARGVIRC